MATYKQAGVNISLGDLCSALAYNAAKKTFPSRKGMIGAPVNIEGGFTGALDFGDFYLVFNSDGVGSKMMIGQMTGKYNTLGFDLLAMVADDAICVGAETVAITNTIDTSKVDPKVVGPLMEGLQKACIQQKVVIPGGEIGEMPDMVKGNMWNSSAIGIVEKNKMIRGENVKPGDKILALPNSTFRSNGFALVRYVLKNKFGEKWYTKKYSGKQTWGDAVIAPSLIFSNALLDILGRYKQKRLCEVKGLAHVTGGGIPGNIVRTLGKFGAHLDNLPAPYKPMTELQKLGNVSDREAYEVWNMGVGMFVVSNEIEKIQKVLKKHKIESVVAGEVVKKPGTTLVSRGYFENGKELYFKP
jgi:phosphoribosylformylglycinamidine cyclo-ligase